MTISHHLRGSLFMLAATTCLATGAIIGKFIFAEGVGPETMLGLRFLLTVAIIWPFYYFVPGWRRLIRFDSGRQFLSCLFVGFFNALAMWLFFIALLELDPGLAELIFSVNPIFVAILLIGLGEYPSRLSFLRFVMGFLGLAFLTVLGVAPENAPSSGAILLILASAVTYAVHLVLYQRFLAGTEPRTNTLYILNGMAIFFVLLAIGNGSFASIGSINSKAWILVALMAVVPTIIARLFVFAGVAIIGGTRAALIGIAEPPTVVLASMILLGERLGASQWLGALLVVASVALVAFDKPPMPARQRVKTHKLSAN